MYSMTDCKNLGLKDSLKDAFTECFEERLFPCYIKRNDISKKECSFQKELGRRL